MAWVEGVVTYSEVKYNRKGATYGALSVEGIQMFCPVEMLPTRGAVVRCFVRADSRKTEDGKYQNSVNVQAVVTAVPA